MRRHLEDYLPGSKHDFCSWDDTAGTSNVKVVVKKQKFFPILINFLSFDAPTVGMQPSLLMKLSDWCYKFFCVLSLWFCLFLYFGICESPAITQKAQGNRGAPVKTSMMWILWNNTLIFLGMVKTKAMKICTFGFNTTLSMIIGASDVSVWSKADQSKTPSVLFSDQRLTIPSGKNIIIGEGGITMWRCCVVDCSSI